ncbi:type I restriction enzyme HsdR N-terminal domain-containing protein [Psychroflexus sp. YR1-1]|uniref:Type I restriction enzyme HsdR N-terminal domain-containing protein n=1 Tax=Psychroflexus aurantiacus TaxID=2709310 RepID=A0A6B3R0S1_9FLAO|nr:type I restriction enzyme HsdR N-terminal domain-containing protein [Psychroflexus aurantiacus]NEV94203.1 type I restriction enzyme HsdR N-terminal domain-containing protein [Psychroflexus aurantiacus]
MQKLNFPEYSFKFKSKENKPAIFSMLRKKYLVLTPEEWVRQHCVQFLISEKKYSLSLLSEERQLYLNGITKRYDIVAYKPTGEIELIVECKAPNIPITQETFDQIARYNLALKADYLMITNGMNHYFCTMDYEHETYLFLEHLPSH